MKRTSLFVLVGIAVGLLSYFIFDGKADIRNYPPKDGPIVAFGDSLVRGVGASEGKDFVSLLSGAVGEPIVNLGVSGDTTASALARIDRVLAEEPRATLVLLGGNDFLRKVPRDETFSNLRKIVDGLQGSGSIVILLGVRDGIFIDGADDMYEDLARETGSAYVSNVLDGIFGDRRYMSDSIHPNDAGYLKIAERVLSVLNEVRR